MSPPPRTRLYVTQALGPGGTIALEEKAAHHLIQVLRLKTGDGVALFNGRDGEWRAVLETASRKHATLSVEARLREQTPPADLWLLAAPLKNGRTDWVVEKATELGASRICPVKTRFTVVDRVNEARLAAIAVEASQQCERLDVPEIAPLRPLETLLAAWPQGRTLIHGDESGRGLSARALLPGLAASAYGLLIGPEGGFSVQELAMLRDLPYVKGVCLGPRVLRADTAAIAALALVQAFCGDWEGKPAFRAGDNP